MKRSIKELANELKIDYLVAQGLVKFLVAQGQAEIVEKRKNLSGKGKPTNIYELPEIATIKLAV